MYEQHMPIPDDECLDMGQLVSLRDGELSPDEVAAAKAHIAHCADCAMDERKANSNGEDVYSLFSPLDPPETPDVKAAFSALQAHIDTQRNQGNLSETPVIWEPRRKRVLSLSKQNRPRLILAAAATLLIAVLLLPNASALADQFLALFSPQ